MCSVGLTGKINVHTMAVLQLTHTDFLQIYFTPFHVLAITKIYNIIWQEKERTD